MTSGRETDIALKQLNSLRDERKVLATTEGFVSEVRSSSLPSQQLSGWPAVAENDRCDSLTCIRSKTPSNLVMTDQSAYKKRSWSLKGFELYSTLFHMFVFCFVLF